MTTGLKAFIIPATIRILGNAVKCLRVHFNRCSFIAFKLLNCCRFFKMGFDFFGYAYAASVVAGGIMGYAKAHSIPSLAAGLVFGGLLAFGAYQFSQNPNNCTISLGASIFLAGLMSYRYFNTGKFMPAGLVACISLINVIRMFYKVAITNEK